MQTSLGGSQPVAELNHQDVALAIAEPISPPTRGGEPVMSDQRWRARRKASVWNSSQGSPPATPLMIRSMRAACNRAALSVA